MYKNQVMAGAAGLALATLMMGLSVGNAAAQFPDKPIELIVPTPPGGGTDIATRFIAEIAQEHLGQKLVVVNKPGGGGTLGVSLVTQAAPDGYTLGSVWNGPLVVTPHTLTVPYSTRDYTAVSLLTVSPVVFCVKPDFPADDGAALIEHLKANPGKYTYGNDGVGNVIHVAAIKIFDAKGVKATPVPFGGAGETLKNFLGGHVDIYGGSIPPILPHVKDGAAKCLIHSSNEPIAALPGSSNLAALGLSDQTTVLWRGVIAPNGVPEDRLQILAEAFAKAAKSEKFQQFASQKSEEGVGSTPQEFRDLIESDYKAFEKVVKAMK